MRTNNPAFSLAPAHEIRPAGASLSENPLNSWQSIAFRNRTNPHRRANRRALIARVAPRSKKPGARVWEYEPD